MTTLVGPNLLSKSCKRNVLNEKVGEGQITAARRLVIIIIFSVNVNPAPLIHLHLNDYAYGVL